MAKRAKMSRRKSKSDYRRKSGVHRKNSIPDSLNQRGGFRL